VVTYRELAVQIGQSFDTYAKYTNLTQLTILWCFTKLRGKSGIDILIATQEDC
jgi:ATP-dependent RNA helicase RhlE